MLFLLLACFFLANTSIAGKIWSKIKFSTKEHEPKSQSLVDSFKIFPSTIYFNSSSK